MTAPHARSAGAPTRQERGRDVAGRRGRAISGPDCRLVACWAGIPPHSRRNLQHRQDRGGQQERDGSQKYGQGPRPPVVLRLGLLHLTSAEDCPPNPRPVLPACRPTSVDRPLSRRGGLSGAMIGPDPDHIQRPLHGGVDMWVGPLAQVYETGPDQGRDHDSPGMQPAQSSGEPACQGGGRADYGGKTSGEDSVEYVPWGLGDERGTDPLPHHDISAARALLLTPGPGAQCVPHDLGSERHRPPPVARQAPGDDPGACDAALHPWQGVPAWTVGGPQPMPPPRPFPVSRRVVLTSVPCRTAAQRVSLALCLLARACQEQVPPPIAGTTEETPPASPDCPLPLMEVSP